MPFFQNAKNVSIAHTEMNEIDGDYIDHRGNGRGNRGSTSPGRKYTGKRTPFDKQTSGLWEIGKGAKPYEIPYSKSRPRFHYNNYSSLNRTDPGPASFNDRIQRGKDDGEQTRTSEAPSRTSFLIDGTGKDRSSFPFLFSADFRRTEGMDTMDAQNSSPPIQSMPGGEDNNRAWLIPSNIHPASIAPNWQKMDVPGSALVSSPERGPVSLPNFSRADSLYYTGSNVNDSGDRSLSKNSLLFPPTSHSTNEHVAHAPTSSAQVPFLSTAYENDGNTFARSEG